MSASLRIRILIAFAVAFLLPATSAFALRPDELLLVVNDTMPESRELAEFYAAARLVPPGRIVGLKLSEEEQTPFEEYEAKIVLPIRQFLRDNHLESQVKCIVLFYGMPLRIGGKVSTPAEKAELEEVRKELADARAQLNDVIVQVETIARTLDPGFTPHAGPSLDDDGRRADVSIRAGLLAVSEMPDEPRRRETAARLVDLLQRLGGAERVAELMHKASGLRQLLPERPGPTTQDVAAAQQQLAALQDQRDDADARRKLRELAQGSFGLFGKARTLQAQAEYLNNDGTAASVDNELALLWWTYYSRSKWQLNPLNFKARSLAGLPPTLMTARLDAPQPDTVRQMILASLRAERDGLKGTVVVDSRGIRKNDGFGAYDQTLRNLATLVRTRTKLKLTFDDRDALFPPHALTDVAVYAGWYSVRNYVPAFTFAPGAIGFHVASFEMVSLRTPNEKGWVANLLSNGVVATVGPVNEPYLHAFPAADEFFPLVMTGRLTLAEAYWRTTPLTSWMMSLVGDPLYRPFAANPALRVEDLPEGLRRAVKPIGGVPTSAPATIPTTAPVSVSGARS